MFNKILIAAMAVVISITSLFLLPVSVRADSPDTGTGVFTETLTKTVYMPMIFQSYDGKTVQPPFVIPDTAHSGTASATVEYEYLSNIRDANECEPTSLTVRWNPSHRKNFDEYVLWSDSTGSWESIWATYDEMEGPEPGNSIKFSVNLSAQNIPPTSTIVITEYFENVPGDDTGQLFEVLVATTVGANFDCSSNSDPNQEWRSQPVFGTRTGTIIGCGSVLYYWRNNPEPEVYDTSDNTSQDTWVRLSNVSPETTISSEDRSLLITGITIRLFSTVVTDPFDVSTWQDFIALFINPC